MSAEPASLSLSEQAGLVDEIVRLAIELERRGDPFLIGHFVHLRERAEMLRGAIDPGCEVGETGATM